MPLIPTLLLLLAVPRAVEGGSEAASVEPTGGSAIARIRLETLEGDRVGLERWRSGPWLVVVWTGVGCPVAQRYATRLNELQRRFAPRGVSWVAVDACPQDSRSEIESEVAELGFELPVVRDPRQELARALGAERTTEVFVLDRSWTPRYRGAIDDQHSRGASLPAPRSNHLADALEALLAGGEPAPARTRAEGCALTLLEEGALPAEVTWAEHVAPILRQNCQSCHRPGQVGPFSLVEYDKAAGWSSMILEVIDQGRMPPWNADEEFRGRFSNERSLTEWEKRVLERWVEAGCPRGALEDEPPAKRWPEGWRLGEPDVVFAMQEALSWDGRETLWKALPEEGFAVPREGVVDYQYFAVETDLPSERWVRAIEVRPGAPGVVHHVLVWAEDPERPGAWRQRGSFESYFAVTVPGDTPSVFPSGAAKRLPAGARLIFQVHYTPDGKAHSDRSRIALFFSEEERPREVHTSALVETDFVIPAHDSAYRVRATSVLEQSIDLLALFPHMHTRGRDFRYSAHLPDGSTRELLSCIFDFNWQESYVFESPLRLPAGTRLECVGHFDNSADNPNNPDPGAAVAWGDQTFEEMFIGYYDWVSAEDVSGSR